MAALEMFDQGLLSLSQSDVPFTVIECEHGIKQEDRALKVLGGIKCITNFDRFWMNTF